MSQIVIGNLDPHGRHVKLCPVHRRVLERADVGEGLMCPAGPGGWHAVEDPLTLDRHTGQVVDTPRPEEDENVTKSEETDERACPGCGRLKRGPGARDGQPCFKCRKKGPAVRRLTLRAPAAREAKPGEAAPAPAQRPGKKQTLERALFEDPRRTMTMVLVERRVPKSGGDPWLVRWTITARKGTAGRKGRAQKGVCATALTEELAKKAWLQLLRKAEAEGWTKVEAPPKRGRELQIEMFPPAMRRPGRRPKKKAA